MESNYHKVHDSLISKRLLLKEAECLEQCALQKRNEAYSDKEIFSEDISILQKELIAFANEYQRLQALLNGAISAYETLYHTEFPSVVDVDFYGSYMYRGISLRYLCEILFAYSRRICDIIGLLNNICDTLGHDFMFVKSDDTFDFDSLETSFEKHDIYSCTCCGMLQLSEPGVEKKDTMPIEKAENLRRVRSLMNFKPFELPFSVIDNLQKSTER